LEKTDKGRAFTLPLYAAGRCGIEQTDFRKSHGECADEAQDSIMQEKGLKGVLRCGKIGEVIFA
jgi:hypothetical protein